MRILVVFVAAGFLAGCASRKVELPRTELPAKPQSSFENVERLSDIEKQKCKETGPEARQVCRKVEKNAEIAEDQQNFVERLYQERDGK